MSKQQQGVTWGAGLRLVPKTVPSWSRKHLMTLARLLRECESDEWCRDHFYVEDEDSE